ncbi:MAG TPA: hypothetical protein VK453_14395 [Micromonosporaceae bacterium]|nr:hypothetical protein [Micromonosporaceae bacterium]
MIFIGVCRNSGWSEWTGYSANRIEHTSAHEVATCSTPPATASGAGQPGVYLAVSPLRILYEFRGGPCDLVPAGKRLAHHVDLDYILRPEAITSDGAGVVMN